VKHLKKKNRVFLVSGSNSSGECIEFYRWKNRRWWIYSVTHGYKNNRGRWVLDSEPDTIPFEMFRESSRLEFLLIAGKDYNLT